MISHNFFKFLLTITLVSLALAANAADISCENNDVVASLDFQKAIDLLDKGKLEPIEEDEVTRLLDLSVARKCKGAAMTLAVIKLTQSNAVGIKNDTVKKNKLDDQIYDLLSAETKLDDGWFELAMFLLTKDSKYYSIDRANQCLEKAISLGDAQAIEFKKEHAKEITKK